MKIDRRYFDSKASALIARKKGDRIYYDAFENKYYLVSSKKNRFQSFWDKIIEKVNGNDEKGIEILDYYFFGRNEEILELSIKLNGKIFKGLLKRE